MYYFVSDITRCFAIYEVMIILQNVDFLCSAMSSVHFLGMVVPNEEDCR